MSELSPYTISLERRIADLELENEFLRRQMDPPIQCLKASDLLKPIEFKCGHPADMPMDFRAYVNADAMRLEDGGWQFFGRTIGGEGTAFPFMSFRAFTTDLTTLTLSSVVERLAHCHKQVCHQLADFLYKRKERTR